MQVNLMLANMTTCKTKLNNSTETSIYNKMDYESYFAFYDSFKSCVDNNELIVDAENNCVFTHTLKILIHLTFVFKQLNDKGLLSQEALTAEQFAKIREIIDFIYYNNSKLLNYIYGIKEHDSFSTIVALYLLIFNKENIDFKSEINKFYTYNRNLNAADIKLHLIKEVYPTNYLQLQERLKNCHDLFLYGTLTKYKQNYIKDKEYIPYLEMVDIINEFCNNLDEFLADIVAIMDLPFRGLFLSTQNSSILNCMYDFLHENNTKYDFMTKIVIFYKLLILKSIINQETVITNAFLFNSEEFNKLYDINYFHIFDGMKNGVANLFINSMIKDDITNINNGITSLIEVNQIKHFAALLNSIVIEDLSLFQGESVAEVILEKALNLNDDAMKAVIVKWFYEAKNSEYYDECKLIIETMQDVALKTQLLNQYTELND